VANGKDITFSLLSANYTAKCTHHPKYRQDSTADWALCKSTRKIEGAVPEVVAQDGAWCAKDVEVTLTGYGCVRNGGGGGNDGVYRIGKSTVVSCPTRDNDVVTKGGAALCYGDSGGPAFLVNADGSREVFGVNSRGNISTTSYLSSVTTKVARDWFAKWQTDNSTTICGFPGSGPCRGGSNPGPDPDPQPVPPDCDSQLNAVMSANGAMGAANAQMHGAATALRSCLTGN